MRKCVYVREGVGAEGEDDANKIGLRPHKFLKFITDIKLNSYIYSSVPSTSFSVFFLNLTIY